MKIPLLALALLAGLQDPPSRPLRDPTEPDLRLRPLLQPPKAPAAPPAVRLSGLVIPQGKPGSGVVEIEGRFLQVAAGDSIHGYRVAGVDAGGLRLEIEATGQALVLR